MFILQRNLWRKRFTSLKQSKSQQVKKLVWFFGAEEQMKPLKALEK